MRIACGWFVRRGGGSVHRMFYMHGAGWGWWVLGSIGMIAFWALVIYAIVWLARGRPVSRREQELPRESAEEIIKRRLAEGEISLEEYERLHAAIHEHAPRGASVEDGRTTTKTH